MSLEKASSGTSRVDFTADPNKTFNRGYTSYFLHGRVDAVGSIDTPKMIGEYVGKVEMASARGVTVDARVSLHPGDGICFFDMNEELRGTLVNGVKGRTITVDKPEGLEKGVIVYRNLDHEFLSKLAKAKMERTIGVSFTLRETPDGLSLEANDEDGNSVDCELECSKELAQKPEQAMENIRKQLSKTGGTDFECTGVTLELSQAYFLPMSTLNALRREALDLLMDVRLLHMPKIHSEIQKNNVPYPKTELSFEANVLNSRADEFYRRHGVVTIEPAAESGLDMRSRRVMTTRYCIRHQLGLCPKQPGAPKVDTPLRLVLSDDRVLKLKFNCTECQMEIHLSGK